MNIIRYLKTQTYAGYLGYFQLNDYNSFDLQDIEYIKRIAKYAIVHNKSFITTQFASIKYSNEFVKIYNKTRLKYK